MTPHMQSTLAQMCPLSSMHMSYTFTRPVFCGVSYEDFRNYVLNNIFLLSV